MYRTRKLPIDFKYYLAPFCFLLLLPLAAIASDNEPEKVLAFQQKPNSEGSEASGSTSQALPASTLTNTPSNSTEHVSSDVEKGILDFAKHEQPQLFELLQYLKQKQPASYQQALKETGRNKHRLEALKTKDAELYEIESALWRTRSKLSFLAAQMSVQNDAELEKQLENLVRDLEIQEISRITLMRDRTAKQLEKLESQLKERKEELSTSIEKDVEAWKQRIKKQRNNPKKPAKQ